MSILYKKTYTLSYEAIDLISEKIQEFCASLKMEKREITRNRLSAEEYLLDWYKELEKMNILPENGAASVRTEVTEESLFGNEEEIARQELRSAAEDMKSISYEDEEFTSEELSVVTLVLGKNLNKYFFRLEKKGTQQNIGLEFKDAGAYSESVLVGLDLKPEYTYKRRTRILTFKVEKKKQNPLITIVEVMAAAVVLGLILNNILPAETAKVLLESVLTPIYDMLFRLLSCIAGPLVLLSVMWGVYGIGDTTMLGKIGKRLVFTFVTIVFAVGALTTVLFPVFHNSISSAGTKSTQLGTLFEMILDIVPGTIIEPFENGNTLQIIFVAFVVGIAMLFLGKKVKVVADVIEQINYIVQFLLDLISRLIPFFIFIIILKMTMSGTFSILGDLWKYCIVFLIALAVVSAIVTIITSIRLKVSPLILLRKSTQTFIICITTASSAAAFGSNIETCERGFGIDPSLTSFGVPLGMVMFKLGTVVYNITLSFYFCNVYQVESSVSWIIMAVVVSSLLSIATPPIPGGGVIAYTVLFTQLGIPQEALAIALSIDMLTDFVITAVNVYNLPLVLMNIADRVGMLNTDILRKETVKSGKAVQK